MEENSLRVAYTAQAYVSLETNGIKRVWLPQAAEGIKMGLHGPIAQHYGVPPGSYEEIPATIDYFVGSITACLAGTLGRALGKAKIPTMNGKLEVDGSAAVVDLHGTLAIREIKLTAILFAAAKHEAEARSIVLTYAKDCPLHRSIAGAINVVTELDFRRLQ